MKPPSQPMKIMIDIKSTLVYKVIVQVWTNFFAYTVQSHLLGDIWEPWREGGWVAMAPSNFITSAAHRSNPIQKQGEKWKPIRKIQTWPRHATGNNKQATYTCGGKQGTCSNWPKPYYQQVETWALLRHQDQVYTLYRPFPFEARYGTRTDITHTAVAEARVMGMIYPVLDQLNWIAFTIGH